MSVVNLEDVKYSYRGSDKFALSNVNLMISEGELTLLAGPTGSGKSTLTFILVGLVPEVIGGTLEGKLSVCGRDPRAAPSTLTGKVGFVAQNFENELFGMTVREDIALGPLNQGVPRKKTMKRTRNLISSLGLKDLEDRYAFNLSRGQKQRVVIASMLAMEPDLLILDEPLAHLSLEGKQKTISLLKKLHREKHIAILLIEHEVKPALKIAQRLILLNQGEIVYDGEPDEQMPLLKELGLRIDQELMTKEKATKEGETILSTSNLSCHRGTERVLNQISLTIRRGEIISIVGSNGAGKTTLALSFADLIPYSGKINRKGNVSMVFQNPETNLVYSTVWQEVYQPAKHSGLNEGEAKNEARKLLEKVNLHNLKDRPPQALSQGQRLKLALVSSLALQPDLLILDEPTFGQDFNGIAEIFELIQTFDDLTVLICTNHEELAETVSNRSFSLEGGKLHPLD